MRSPQAFSGFFPAALLAMTLCLRAEEPPQLRADLDYASQYVFRGVNRAGASAQGSVEVTRENFRLSFGGDYPFAAAQESEAHLSAAYGWHATEQLTLEATAEPFWYGNVPADGTKRSFEAGLTATVAPIDGFVPRLDYYHDFRLRANTVQTSLAHSIALTGFGAFLDLSIYAGWVSGDDWRPDVAGPPRHDSYRYWGVEAQLPYRMGTHSMIRAAVHYADAAGLSPTDGPSGRSGGQRIWFTLGVSLDF